MRTIAPCREASIGRVFDSIVLDEDARRALREDLARESMCVMIGSDDCDEEISGPRLATVNHGR